MIRLKLSRGQLDTLCKFTNPAQYEARATLYIKLGKFEDLDRVYNLVQIGEMVAKKYLFSNNKNYSISLNLSQAASLLQLTHDLEQGLDPLSYELNLALIIRAELHSQITNHQTKYNGQRNSQAFTLGANSSYIKALDRSAR